MPAARHVVASPRAPLFKPGALVSEDSRHSGGRAVVPPRNRILSHATPVVSRDQCLVFKRETSSGMTFGGFANRHSATSQDPIDLTLPNRELGGDRTQWLSTY